MARQKYVNQMDLSRDRGEKKSIFTYSQYIAIGNILMIQIIVEKIMYAMPFGTKYNHETVSASTNWGISLLV